MEMRVATETERMYAYSQSSQISGQTGLIGYLRADMDSNGQGFFSTWNDYRRDIKTEEFKAEFDDVINALRFDKKYGDVLKSRNDMEKYCRSQPDSAFDGSYTKEYAFRVNTDKYAYIIRLNPTKGDYNLYCFCYVREWLDSHLRQAEKGIRFIDPHYKELFRIKDGDKVQITYSDGKKDTKTCRYIDDYHLEVGRNQLYHICEYAELNEQNGNTVIPYRDSLPDMCYSILPSTKELIIIKKGEKGYFPCEFTTDNFETNREIATEKNNEVGITKAQEAAMLTGSMFGWEVPTADLKMYDTDGMAISLKPRDRGEAR